MRWVLGLPFGMSQEIGMGWLTLIPAWAYARKDFQNSQPVISCHRAKRSCSLFFHSGACDQKPAEIILRRFVCSVNIYLKSLIKMTEFEENKTKQKKPQTKKLLIEQTLSQRILSHLGGGFKSIVMKSQCRFYYGLNQNGVFGSSVFQPICSM